MDIRVTSDQVDNARLLVALDRAQGRESDEWIIRLASARATTATGQPPAGQPAATIAGLDERLRVLEAEVVRLSDCERLRAQETAATPKRRWRRRSEE